MDPKLAVQPITVTAEALPQATLVAMAMEER
jgi:hypothetical protein